MTKISRELEWLKGNATDTFFKEETELSGLQVTFSQPGEAYPLPNTPSYIALEVTNACNLRCTHCHYRHGAFGYTRDIGYMPEYIFENAISQAVEHNITVLMNYDGEPLMHPLFIEYLKRATELGVTTYFNTNATLLTPQKIDQILSFYNGSIFVSMEGGREWFEKIRIPASYDTVCSNLNYLIKANKEKGRPLQLSISVSNLGQPYEERCFMLEKWLGKVDSISFGEVNDDAGTIVSNPYIQMKPSKRPLCVVPWQTCGICHNGDVIPCSIYIAKANVTQTILGNLEEQRLESIWKGEAYQEFRNTMLERNCHDDICAKCERWRSQFSFGEEIRDQYTIIRNGFWTVFKQNKDKE